MTITEAYQEAIRKHIEEVQAKEMQMVLFMPSLSVEPARVAYNLGLGAYFEYPYSRPLMAQIQAEVEAQGWQLTGGTKEQDVDAWWQSPTMVFSKWLGEEGDWKNRISMTFEFDDNVQGSTCKRKVVQELPATQDKKFVYEWVCQEEA